MGKKKKKKKSSKAAEKKAKYTSKVDERIKKLATLEADGDSELWKANDKKIEEFSRYGFVKRRDKVSPKEAARTKR